MKNIFKNKLIVALLLGMIIVSGFFASSVLAQSGGKAGLVPCGNGSNSADRCTLCHLVLGFRDIIDYGFKILIFVALAMLLAAGILYIFSAGEQGLITTAKGMMKNTLFGFGFVLLAWLIVNVTIFVLGANVGIEKTGVTWDSFTCNKIPGALNSAPSPNPVDPNNPTPNCIGTVLPHTQPCDNQNPKTQTEVNLKNGDCIDASYGNYVPGKCTYACNDGYSRKSIPGSPGKSECSPDQIIPCEGTMSGHCEDSCSGARTEFTDANDCTSKGKKCCTFMDVNSCKSGNAADQWNGACFEKCLDGWTEKTGGDVVLGIKCQANGWKCCKKNP